MIKGLKIKDNFLTIQEEQKILTELKAEQGDTEGIRIIPDYLKEVTERLKVEKYLMCDDVSVTTKEYFKGQELKWCIKTPESGKVTSFLSLLGDATLVFRNDEGKYYLRVPPRSLVQITDEIWLKWEHCIEPLKERRYVITFKCNDV